MVRAIRSAAAFRVMVIGGLTGNAPACAKSAGLPAIRCFPVPFRRVAPPHSRPVHRDT